MVSRETAAGSLTGRLPALIESGELESAVGLPMNKETSHVMLCGNPQMVRDTQQLLEETRQMTKHLRRRPGHMTAGITGKRLLVDKAARSRSALNLLIIPRYAGIKRLINEW